MQFIKWFGSNYTGSLSRGILIIGLCMRPLFGLADIYQWQDNDGHQHFSDRSVAQAKKLTIKPGYGFYQVTKVFDGDTVLLSDGRKIRLLGINAPEIEHRNKMADAGGDEAKQWLIKKLQNNKVRLLTDSEKTDKYGRTLAHLFTESHEHINLQLVALGLAQVNIHPPNLLFTDLLLQAQRKAEANQLGLWRHADYAVNTVGSLAVQKHRSWVRIAGIVIAIKQTRKFAYLYFSGPFEVRIERQWLALFPDLKTYIGKSVEARGWINKRKDRFSMLAKHPSALIIR
jgi:endonuclease YncB( thermonuclease family)